MQHDHVDLPTQRQDTAGVLPVVAAVESARSLREQVTSLPTATASERATLRHELALLRLWLQTTEAETTAYHAVVEGLTHFAASAETCLADAETEGPDGPVSAVPA
jgi:hypothetical protein